MKKILTLILAIFYAVSSTGATFDMHYCMGKLVHVKLWGPDAGKQCARCGYNASRNDNVCRKKCCRDVHKTVKLEKDQQAAERTVHFTSLPAIPVVIAYPELPQIQLLSQAVSHPVSHAPPHSGKVPPHIWHCTFRI
ncbi:HYC_CC_PP family protein [Chitinophaga nivalis]|uniref:Uncharacterized protein n=1 Tax=Chitinophaga nivalis TaxID=2991709 RepID=A0ABT3IQ62_9BACT|nr:hypothetical protein [Chitinophaga nivalis]MCW3464193.1 hypothetical protein [Chitinophaga nivalis]MCW3486117.1 hypothetical protein [Chitinophaga nivalis]